MVDSVDVIDIAMEEGTKGLRTYYQVHVIIWPAKRSLA